MKYVLITSERAMNPVILRCPRGLDVQKEWEEYSEVFNSDRSITKEPSPRSYLGAEKRMSFIEYLVYHKYCIRVLFLEVIL